MDIPISTVNDIRDLRTLGRDDTAFAGSKAAQLGELFEAGLPVPPGFVVGAPAYRAFLDSSGLRERMGERLAGVDANDPVALDSASVHIRAEVNAAEIPSAVEDAILAAYGELGSPPVAVRASTTSENTSAASFAGTTEARLGIVDEVSLLRAVRHCWSSLFTAQHIFYAAKHGRSAIASEMGVLVQRQIDAQKAGMMLTVDPVSGVENRVVIEATLGLGEAVAGGSVSPDRYVVDKETRSTITKQIRHKEVVIAKEPGDGNAIRRLGLEDQDASVLDELELRLLVELGLKAERFFNEPQSMEWAIDPEGVTWMLQARPAPVKEAANRDEPGTPGIVRGECAMTGVVAGRARVVASVEDAGKFVDDEILVTHRLAPEWTPLMQRASAVVTDSGGVTSHAATVARELEIPCVVGTETATRQVRTGDLIMVDATSGMVVPG